MSLINGCFQSYWMDFEQVIFGWKKGKNCSAKKMSSKSCKFVSLEFRVTQAEKAALIKIHVKTRNKKLCKKNMWKLKIFLKNFSAFNAFKTSFYNHNMRLWVKTYPLISSHCEVFQKISALHWKFVHSLEIHWWRSSFFE